MYQRQYESGGQFWPLVAHKVVGCTLIGVLFTAVVLVLKHAYTQAAVLVVTLPLYLLRFDLYVARQGLVFFPGTRFIDTRSFLFDINSPRFLSSCRYLRNRYDAVVAQVPLMAVHAAGRVATVDPNLWTPPPLRQGATGWNPEWGKVWQWWGVPRSTL